MTSSPTIRHVGVPEIFTLSQIYQRRLLNSVLMLCVKINYLCSGNHESQYLTSLYKIDNAYLSSEVSDKYKPFCN